MGRLRRWLRFRPWHTRSRGQGWFLYTGPERPARARKRKPASVLRDTRKDRTEQQRRRDRFAVTGCAFRGCWCGEVGGSRCHASARFMGAAAGRADRLEETMSEPRLVDVTGRMRSPAATPGHGAGCVPPNKGMRFPADPPTVEEIILLMREAGPRPVCGPDAGADRVPVASRVADQRSAGAHRVRSGPEDRVGAGPRR